MSSEFPSALSGLLSPAGYSHPVDTVLLVQTHISWVLLAGAYAYKIKRPVHLSFIDMRSLERRRFLCQEELRLNRRFAPQLYLEVCSIVLSAGAARIGADGAAVEYAVRMRRFERAQELDRLLAVGQISPAELARFGEALAAVHQRAPAAAVGTPWGEPGELRALMLRNLAENQEAAISLGRGAAIEALRAPLLRQLSVSEPALQERRRCGRVRECHGDLHARNIVRLDGQLVAFDCVEFEPAFRWIDVADDAALLLVDLQARECEAHAHAFWCAYLASSGDYDSLRVLDLYRAHRALVRAKVAALGLEAAAAPAERQALQREHGRLLLCAAQALQPRPRRLVLMCGLSGSGKSWLAQRLAAALQLVPVRSDIERKRLAGMEPLAASGSALHQGLYAPGASEAVYARLEACARSVLAGGHGVLLDAAFLLRRQRLRLIELAAATGAQLRIVYCHAQPKLLRARIARRALECSDPSEADQAVLDWQLRQFEPILPAEGAIVIDVDTGSELSLPRVLAALG